MRTDREIALLCEWLQLAEVSSLLLQFPEFRPTNLRNIGWVDANLWTNVKRVCYDAYTLQNVQSILSEMVIATESYDVLRSWRVLGFTHLDDLSFLRLQDWPDNGFPQNHYYLTVRLHRAANAARQAAVMEFRARQRRCRVCGKRTNRYCRACGDHGEFHFLCSDACRFWYWDEGGHRENCCKHVANLCLRQEVHGPRLSTGFGWRAG